MAKMIDLGREYPACEPCCAPAPEKSGKKKISYPSLYIHGVNGLDFSTGEISGRFRGKVVMVREQETHRDNKKEEDCSYEIEIHSMSIDDSEAREGGLDETIDRIAAKKASKGQKKSEEYGEE